VLYGFIRKLVNLYMCVCAYFKRELSKGSEISFDVKIYKNSSLAAINHGVAMQLYWRAPSARSHGSYPPR